MNLFYTKGKLSFFVKLVNFKFILTVVYFIVLFSSFLTLNSQSVLICSAINNTMLLVHPLNNFLIFIVFYYVLSVKDILMLLIKQLFNFKSNTVKTVNNSNNLFVIVYYIYNNFNLFLNNLGYLVNYYLNLFSKKFVNFYFLNWILKLVNSNLKQNYWYTVFKRHSIFGYYRISRQRWVELKSEEVNFLKY